MLLLLTETGDIVYNHALYFCGVQKKRVATVNGQEVKLVFFDTAGQERFRTLTSGYYTNTHVAIIVYDSNDEQSYIDLPHWVRDVTRYTKDSVMIILSNKCDLGKGKIEVEEAQSYAEANRCKFFTVSAKDGTGIDDAFNSMVQALLEKKNGTADAAAEKKSGCCLVM